MRTAFAVVLAASLIVWSAGCRAEEANAAASAGPATVEGPTGAEVEPMPSAGDTPRPRVARPHVRRTPGQGIEQTVARLARGLGLDGAQQASLRRILWDEQRQARQLRGNPGAGVDWPSATAAIIEQTRARIRALLTDEQKARYSVDVPRAGLAPAQADLQHYLQLQDSRRQQDGEAAR